MNIWIIDHYSSEPQNGGITRQYDFAKEFSRRGYNVIVIASSFSHFTHKYLNNKKMYISKIGNNANYIYLKTLSYLSNRSFKRILSMIDFMNKVKNNYTKLKLIFGEPDVVIGCSIHPLAWKAAYYISKKAQAKFIAEVRDLWPAMQIYDQGMSPRQPLIKYLANIEKWAYDRADKIIYSMAKGDNYICDILGYPKDKAIWIDQPMDIERFDSNRNRFDELPDDLKAFIGNSFLCVFTGYYVDYEGVMEMLGSAKIIKQHNTEIKYVFVGSGRCDELMHKYVIDNKLDNVYIGGRIDKQLVPALLNRAQVCLAHLAIKGNTNSYRFDASKNKLTEYMYSNSCIIYGTYIKNQFIQTSGSGITINPYDENAFANAIEQVYKMDKSVQEMFGYYGKKYVLENNLLSKLVDKYETIFK